MLTKPGTASRAEGGPVAPRSFVDVLTIALLAIEELDRQCRLDGDDAGVARVALARESLHGLQDRRRVTT
jgi:hypothetical protein